MNLNLYRSLFQTIRDPKNRRISVAESPKPRHYLRRGFQEPPVFRGLICALIVFFPFSTFAASAKLLVKNARIFSMAPQQRAPFTGYFVVAEDGTLTTVSAGDPPSGITAEQVFDAHGEWIIPGLISAHSHLWQAAYRGLAGDKTLISWINDLYFQRAAKASPDDLYWFCLLGALDHLQNGITTAYNFNYTRIYWRGDDNDFDEAQFRAEEKSGIRFVHGYEPGMMAPGIAIDQARKRLKAFLDWTVTQPPSSDFLSVMINGGTAFNNTYQQSVMEKALMVDFSLRNQSHYLEPPEPLTQGEERAEFRWFMDSGMLSNKLIFGHFIHTDEYILQMTAKNDVAMTWNPLSNGRMASGVPDIPKYLKMGIRVGMGIDGEASGDLADPFENMRAGLYAVRDKYEDATVISPYQVLWLHTMGSADVLGVKNKLGSLEPGKFADFVVIDPARLGAVLEDPYANLVLVTSQPDIDRVYVGGDLKVEHGRLLQQDVAKIQTEVNQRVTATSR
jgi:5-methylthioadenosine/S-adenosylhomocysteine deaminase